MPFTYIGRPTVYLMAIIYVSMIGMTIACLVYTNHVAQKSGQQWCEIVTTLDDAYKQVPPTTPVGVKLATEMHRLRAGLHCK